MAEQTGEKKHAPTHHKLLELRKQGRWFSSKDLTHAVQLVAAAAVADSTGSVLVSRLEAFMVRCFGPENFRVSGERVRLDGVAAGAWSELLILSVPWALLLAACAALMLWIQVRPMCSAKPLTPQFERINPFAGIKRLFFRPRTWRNFSLTLLKLSCIGGFLYYAVRSSVRPLTLVPEAGLDAAGILTWGLLIGLMWKAAAVFIPLGMVDYLQQKRDFMKENSLTDEEMKRELKENEPSPETRGRIHRRRREILAGTIEGGLERVLGAAVAITGDHGQTVAIGYDPDKDAPAGRPPSIMAKGSGQYGRQIQWRAQMFGIPMRHNPRLADSLFRVELGTHIPEELFQPMLILLEELYNPAPPSQDQE